MFKLEVKSAWIQAGLRIHMARSSRANSFGVQQLVCSNKKISPLDLFRTYFKYLVSQIKVFLLECGSFLYQQDKLQQWIYTLDGFIFRNIFRVWFGLVWCLETGHSLGCLQRNGVAAWPGSRLRHPSVCWGEYLGWQTHFLTFSWQTHYFIVQNSVWLEIIFWLILLHSQRHWLLVFS